MNKIKATGEKWQHWTMLIGIGLVLSLFLLTTPMVAQWDAYDRSIIAAKLRVQGTIFDMNIIGNFWLPFHLSFLAASLFIYDNLYFTPRFFTLIISLASVIAMYYYSLRLMPRDRSLALLSAFLFLFFPQRIILSTKTLSEPIFIFFILTSLILAFRRKPKYFLSLIFLNIAHGIRYESWFALPIFWWLFVNDADKSMREKITLILLSVLIPIWWLLLNIMHSGNPLAFFSLYQAMAREMPRPEYWDFNLAFATWWEKLTEVLTTPILLVIGYGIYRRFKKRLNWKQSLLIITPFYFFFLLVILMFFGLQEGYDHRYVFLSSSLMMPLLAYGIRDIYSFVLSKSRFEYLPYLLILQLFLVFEVASMAINLNVYMTRNRRYLDNLNKLLISYRKISEKGDIKTPVYYYSESKRRWAEKAFAYYTGQFELPSRPKRELFQQSDGNNSLFIVERNSDEDWQGYTTNFDLRYQNADYLLLTPKHK